MSHIGCLLAGQNLEHFLRQDNADLRLTELSFKIGFSQSATHGKGDIQEE